MVAETQQSRKSRERLLTVARTPIFLSTHLWFVSSLFVSPDEEIVMQ